MFLFVPLLVVCFFSSLKSAAKSINVLFLFRCLEISCASPFGRAVKIISTFFNNFLLNLIILGNFLFDNDFSKNEIFLLFYLKSLVMHKYFF